ncbi:hypothetical protein M5W70_18385 [Paenibacillus larvae]|uniref:hypothetical protein n=1 Tax=Paenibacillus larvae TaxID=1464 RepID=UPI00227F3673|nr:hypothetical protein [Paenibacillus larvae]MCY9690593.1 hypothetical protein [Paenibacillus larvae]
MKIRMIKEYESGQTILCKGEIFVVRKFSMPLKYDAYQIIAGDHSGMEIPGFYCIELPEEKIYSETEYNELKEQLEKTKRELEEEKRDGALRMIIQEAVDAWFIEPSAGSDPKDAEILTKRILHAVVPFCKQA